MQVKIAYRGGKSYIYQRVYSVIKAIQIHIQFKQFKKNKKLHEKIGMKNKNKMLKANVIGALNSVSQYQKSVKALGSFSGILLFGF